MKVLLEVNVSGESAKFGLKPGEVAGVVSAASHLKRIEIRGLMTMPPLSDDAEKGRDHFRTLRGLGEKLGLTDLSMGMSHDFEVAIEEGARWVRVGTALFGERVRAEQPA
jgi:hypothetical protein